MPKFKVAGLYDSEGKADFAVYPEGKYLMEVKRINVDDTSDSTMVKVRVNYEIIESVDDPEKTPDVEGKPFTQFINIFTENHASYEQWGHIGRGEFKDLLNAAGVSVTKSDNFEGDQLVGAQIVNKIKVKPAEGNFKERNEVVKSYPA